jgi:hypothetical protein
MQATGGQGGCKRVGDVLLPHDLGKGARADPVVEGLGQAKPSAPKDGTPAAPEATPRAPARACLPLLPSGPGGVQRVTPREGSQQTIPARGSAIHRVWGRDLDAREA